MTYHRSGRSIKNIALLILSWAILIALYVLVDAAPMIIAVLGLFTLPLAWEIGRNAQSHLTFDQTTLSWHSLLGHDTLPVKMIDGVRFDRRLDLSVRVTLRLTDGRKIRLPHDVTPPHRPFRTALEEAGVRTEFHQFSLIG